MDTRYNHAESEDRIYKSWEKSGYFTPEGCIKAGITNKSADHFSIVLPPPNVTGTLHMGSALMVVIQDILIRYNRMMGKKTLWIPGTDHAAIATQSKVEGIIYKEEGKTRHDLGREELLRRINEFAKTSHDTIVNQIRKMGASVDWNREAFTLDEKRNLAVKTAFKNMYDDGLIYQGYRIVNWDPKLQTTVSDDEVERIEEKSPLYYLKYGPFVIATARPETKFGDKYVVMHPDDKRYKKYKHGEKISLEWINGPITATVIKDKTIDMSFGTGVMTITPAHDLADFEIAERHKLDKEQIIDLNGKLLPIAGEFSGMHIKKARPLILEKLKSKALLEKVDENYTHSIATNERGGGVIEPQIIKQWFIDVNKKFSAKGGSDAKGASVLRRDASGGKIKNSKLDGIKSGSEITLKELMKNAVSSGQIKITPDRFEKVYYHWIENLRDWCISRQIWYGHRIPVWYCASCNTIKVNADIKSKWFFVRHGETDWNKEKKMQGRKDIPLNTAGREQAEHVGKLLANRKIDLVLSSDLLRAKETAEIIASIAKTKEILFDKELQEKHYGQAEGMAHDEFIRLYRQVSDTEVVPPEGESYQEVEKRIWKVIETHKAKHAHKNIVIVSHGDVLRTLLKKIRGWSLSQMLASKALSNSEFAEFDVLDPCVKCGNHLFEQDSDVLDTWFSSGLWTFSTLGWPQETGANSDFKNYHPTSVIETGYDILFPWVARMILMAGYHIGDVPFRKVYLHGLVRDDKGRKMSKSLGNIIDPLTMSEKYGADATRLSLIIGTAPGNDTRISEDKIRGYRNFTTKIWNAGRFILMNYKESDVPPEFTTEDKKNLEELAKIKADITKYIEEFDFNRAGETLYHYFWHTFADKIIEASKPRLNSTNIADRNAAQEVLMKILKESLKMLHPFIPFVTEEVWSKIPGTKNQLIIEKW